MIAEKKKSLPDFPRYIFNQSSPMAHWTEYKEYPAAVTSANMKSEVCNQPYRPHQYRPPPRDLNGDHQDFVPNRSLSVPSAAPGDLVAVNQQYEGYVRFPYGLRDYAAMKDCVRSQRQQQNTSFQRAQEPKTANYDLPKLPGVQSFGDMVRSPSPHWVGDVVTQPFTDRSRSYGSHSIAPGSHATGGVCSKTARCSVQGCVPIFFTEKGACSLHHAEHKANKNRTNSEDSATSSSNNRSQGKPGNSKRKRCKVEGCTKQCQNKGVCIAHGASVKRCSVDGCTKYALTGGICISHGAKVRRCKVDGCPKHAQVGGVCVAHGAKLKRCCIEGCKSQARKKGKCRAHRDVEIETSSSS